MGLAGGEADESTIPLYAQCVDSVELMFVEEKFWNFTSLNTRIGQEGGCPKAFTC